MKKLVWYSAAFVLFAVAVYAVYCYGFRKSMPVGNQAEMVRTVMLQSDCYMCHSENSQLPFYYSLPLVKNMISGHVRRATDFLNLDSVNFNPGLIDEVSLAKIEYALEEETMPILPYRLVHWGTAFTDTEEDILDGWIKQARMRFSSPESEFSAFSPVPQTVPYDVQKADLGFRLYNDLRLSKDGTVSCASCHQLQDGGADHRGTRTSEGIGGQFGGVNAPTVYNSYFNVRQFWNGRAADLKEQAAGPPVNPVEMGDQTLDDIVARLQCDKELVADFAKAYPGEGLTPSSMTDAIAEFEKTLLTTDSRFDYYIMGNDDVFSDLEEDGYETFMEKGCVACHTGVNLGGRSFEKLSIYGDYFADRDESILYNSDDDGLKGFTGKDSDLHRFKVPGLRTVALTAPYFHDGSVSSLQDAVAAMSRYEFGKELNACEINEITAFLCTLTGKNQYLQK